MKLNYWILPLYFMTSGILFASIHAHADQDGPPPTSHSGAVYAMSNEFAGNRIVGYGRNEDGTLELLGQFPTGGIGAAFDGGEGLDPLISAYSLVPTSDNKFLLAVNAGSNSLTVFRVNKDWTLTRTDTKPTKGVGPNSIAYHGKRIYVSNIDADGDFVGEPDQEGNLVGFKLTPRGKLISIPQSIRPLQNRPAAIQFSPDGKFLVVSSINAGSATLASGSADELIVYGVQRNGQLTVQPVGRGASTLPLNDRDRNLPSAIGFEIVKVRGNQFVVVTEAREFQADGSPPAFDRLQTGSVSTWKLNRDGTLTPVDQDVLAGEDFFDGERTACWIEFSRDGEYFWVSNALESTLSSFRFNQDGTITLLDRVAARGTPPADGDPFGTTDGWIDLWLSGDGKFLYQLFGLDGTIGVYKVDGSSLSFIQEVSGDLPQENTQGIVAIDRQSKKDRSLGKFKSKRDRIFQQFKFNRYRNVSRDRR